MNTPFLTFLLLAFIPPAYERWERAHQPPDAWVPTQIKWTAQIAVGSAAAAQSVCHIISSRRSLTSGPGEKTSANLYCASLGGAGGAMSAAAMVAQGWGEPEWAFVAERWTEWR
ncbi:unnamed protein product [Discula destructiva]